MIQVYRIFFTTWLFGAKNSPARRAVRDLFEKSSYRYSSKEQADLFATFRCLVQGLQLIWKPVSPVKIQPIMVYDIHLKFKDGDLSYLRYNGVPQAGFISRDEMSIGNFLFRLVNSLALFVLATVILPKSLLSTDRRRAAMIIPELAGISIILTSLLDRCREVYYFSAYEKETMFCSVLLRRAGIKVYLIPSSNPIHYFYKFVSCDTFIITAPFQILEMQRLRENWDIKEYKIWKPFESDDIVLNNGETPKYDIGLMSSATHLRVKEGHFNPTGFADYKAEQAMITCIAQMVKQRGYKVLIYLHPSERKSTETMEVTRDFYRTHFEVEPSFAPIDKPSRHYFNLVNIAVAGFSSVQIERLYGGYKTIFAPMGFLENYFEDTRLEAISAGNDVELKNLLAGCLILSDSEFFKRFGLQAYHHDYYDSI